MTTVSSRGIAQLLFSTRAADPRSGSDYNREIIARTPGLPEAAVQAMVRTADMTGPALGVGSLPPVWALRRIDAGSWLLIRAVSLGSYRKGYHQLLVHGLVLGPEHLRALGGNPFLLDPSLANGETAGAGFAFREQHPGSGAELPPLYLPAELGARAEGLNRERRTALARTLADHDDGLAHALSSLRDRSTATAFSADLAPGREVAEWVLLHLHPEDRARVDFHTYYAYESAERFDLIGLPEGGAAPVRRMLRRLTLWGGEGSDARASEEGLWRVELRRRRPDDFDGVLADYRLTVLPSEHPLGLDGRNLPVLSPEDSAICLRYELGHPLTARQREVRLRCYGRGRNVFEIARRELAGAWEEGEGAFDAYLEGLRRHPPDLPRDEVERQAAKALAEAPDRGEAWGVLAAFWAVSEARGWDASFAARLWGKALEEGGFSAWRRHLAPGERREVLWKILAFYVDGRVAHEAAEGAAPSWAPYLRWAGEAGRSAAAAAAAVEKAVNRTAERAPGAPGLLRAYRELQKVCFELDLEAFGLRVLFEREIPRLEGDARHIRLGDGVRRLLAPPTRSDGVDALVGPYLERAETARTVFAALVERLGEAADGWDRCRAFLNAQGGPLPPASREPAGELLARLALSPRSASLREGLDLVTRLGRKGAEKGDFLRAGLGPRPSEASERGGRIELLTAAARAARLSLTVRDVPIGVLTSGLSAFLAVRAVEDGALPESETLDIALLDLLDDGLLLTWAGPGRERPAPARLDLRRRTAEYVADLLDRDFFPAGPERVRRWRHLLFDELLDERRGPMGEKARGDDALYRACVALAWRAWAGRSEAPGPRFAVWRLLTWDPRPEAAAETRQTEWLRAASMGRLLPAARQVLRAAFPDRRAA